MARPSNANLVATTPGGIEFQWDLTSYTSRVAPDANQVSILAIVAWALADDFETEVVGTTSWDGTSPTLQRSIPLLCPLRTGLFCDDCTLVDYGAYESRTDFNNIINGNQPVNDWKIYRLTFIRPGYWVRTDDSLKNVYGNLEHHRYCKFSMLPRGRERVVSGYGFEYLPTGGNAANPGDWKTVPDERQFVPDWQQDVTVQWMQVPIGAVPYKTIIDTQNTVNTLPTQLVSGGREWKPGELLFKGLAEPMTMHFQADNTAVMHLAYKWTVQPGTWNKHQVINPATGVREYRPVRVRKAVNVPPYADRYPATDHRKLFVPASEE